MESAELTFSILEENDGNEVLVFMFLQFGLRFFDPVFEGVYRLVLLDYFCHFIIFILKLHFEG